MADALLCTLVFVFTAGLGVPGSRQFLSFLFCKLCLAVLGLSCVIGSSESWLWTTMTSPWCFVFFFFCYTTVSGLFLCLLSWAILTLLGKVKDKLAVPATVQARAVRCRRRLCPLQPREMSFG